jgi:hypothetical protein
MDTPIKYWMCFHVRLHQLMLPVCVRDLRLDTRVSSLMFFLVSFRPTS